MVLFDFAKESCSFRIQDMWMEMMSVYFDVRFAMTTERHLKFFTNCVHSLIKQTLSCWESRNSKKSHDHTSLLLSCDEDMKTLMGFCYENSWRNSVLFESPKSYKLRTSSSNNTAVTKEKGKGNQTKKKYPVELSPPKPKQIKRSARGATPPLPLPPAKRRRVKKLQPNDKQIDKNEFTSDKEIFLNAMKLVFNKKKDENDKKIDE